jgi:hypothetical protein
MTEQKDSFEKSRKLVLRQVLIFEMQCHGLVMHFRNKGCWLGESGSMSANALSKIFEVQPTFPVDDPLDASAV